VNKVNLFTANAETPCPLCGSMFGTLISTTPFSAIWSNLFAEWGAIISDDVKVALSPRASVELQTCSGCQLQYFSPAIPGSSEFYAELTSSCPRYYVEHKWEFDYIKPFLRRDHRVLDVACGKGAFLRSIVDLVSATIGIDTNPDARINACDTKVQIFNQSVEEFSVKHSEEFDVVSAFQVVEHLGSVRPFVLAAYRCVKPGGLLVLSVPNRARRKDVGFESLDYPPHHLSRWSENQLSVVAQILGGELLSISREPLNNSQTIRALRNKELPELLPRNFAGREVIFKLLSRLLLIFPLSLVWQRMKLADRLGMYGMSMVAIIRKSSTRT
jgi:2-polyprenyl-3-methyl-5-hydroxy-6-metoxy-1,4-benzoquinol methylase